MAAILKNGDKVCLVLFCQSPPYLNICGVLKGIIMQNFMLIAKRIKKVHDLTPYLLD